MTIASPDLRQGLASSLIKKTSKHEVAPRDGNHTREPTACSGESRRAHGSQHEGTSVSLTKYTEMQEGPEVRTLLGKSLEEEMRMAGRSSQAGRIRAG